MNMRIFITTILGLFLSTAYADDFMLKSSAFANNQPIPKLYTCDGENLSPDLSWKNPPARTQSYVIIFSAPDSPVGEFYNWIIYNIPTDITNLAAGASKDMPDGILTGHNYFDESSYRGPCPFDDNTYHYVFTIYALDTMLDLEGSAKIDDVINAMKRHILSQAKLTGIYRH